MAIYLKKHKIGINAEDGLKHKQIQTVRVQLTFAPYKKITISYICKAQSLPSQSSHSANPCTIFVQGML